MAFENSIYEADVVAFGKIVDGNERFVIPDYQRPYSWDEEMATQLLTDTWEHCYSKKRATVDKEFFLGSIVFSIGNQATTPKIIDGQQRFTTLFLIHLAVNSLLSEEGQRSLAKQIENAIYAKKSRVSPKLELTKPDRDFFRELYRTSSQEDLDEFRRKKREVKVGRAPDCALFDNFLDLREKLQELIRNEKQARTRDGKLTDYLEYLHSSVKLALVSVQSESNAFQVFQALNDKRLELSSADLIKVEVFTRLAKLRGNKFEEGVKKNWDSLLENLGTTSGSDAVKFLRAFHFMKYGHISKSNLVRSYREKLKNVKDARQLYALTEELSVCAKHYRNLVRAEVPSNSNLNSMLRGFKSLGMSQHIPLFLAALSKKTNLRALLRLTVIVDYLAIRVFSTTKITANVFEHLFAEWTMTLYFKSPNKALGKIVKDIKAELRHLKIDNISFKRSFLAKPFNDSQSKYILQRIERFVAKDGPEKYFSDKHEIELEHILPKKANKPCWKQSFPNENEHAELRSNLGNLTILWKPLNGGIGNECYTEKRKEYRRQKIKITSRIAKDHGSWTRAAIFERQEHLADLALRVWGRL